jgi:Tfp pilus assembly protein PilF
VRKLSNGLTTIALGMVVLGGGHLAERLAVAAESAWKPKTLPGVATAKSIGSALKSGMVKVGDVLVPSPSVTEAPDPISLSTKTDPSPELYLSMAAVAEESDNVAGARKHYQQALELAPERFDVILQYARFRDRHGELAEATELYQRAVRSNADEPSVFNDLGLCFARRNMLPQSLSALERAIQLAPDRRLYRNNIATVLVELGNVDAAFGHLKAVHDEAVAYYNLGFLMLKKGESRAAARLFSEALAKNPSLVEARIWLRKLESNGAESQNARRQAPQLRSATRQPLRPADTPRLSVRPSPGKTTVQGRQLQLLPPQPMTTTPAPAVGPGRNPAHMAPLPPRTVVRDGSRPSTPGTRPSVPVRTTVPDSRADKQPAPVLQPLPPVEK